MGNRPDSANASQQGQRFLPGVWAVLGILWALPLTLAGFCLLLPVMVLRGQIDIVLRPTPALLVRGPLVDRLLRHHPFGDMSAMAIGHMVLARRHELTPQILMHELAHVRQAAHWGCIFPFAYLAASVWAKLRGQDAYWNNVFEVAARRAEKH